MGSSGIVGLLFEISADPSKAADALQRFEQATGKSFEKAAAGTKPLDTALLSNRESVRLLTEETGIHLPRAVTGAIAEMLPSIGQLGGTLLGVFAIEQAVKWGAKAIAIIQDLQSGTTAAVDEIGKAAEAAAKHAHDEIGKIFADFKTAASGQLPMEEVELRAKQLTKYYQAFLDLEKAQNEMRQPTVETMQIVGQAVGEGLTNIEDVRQKLNEVSTLQLAQHKRLGELEKKESKEACDAAIKDLDRRNAAENKSLELARHVAAEKKRLMAEGVHGVEELTKGAKAYNDALALSRNRQIEHNLFLEKMARDEIAFLPLQQRGIEMARQEIQVFTADATAVRHLTAAYSDYLYVKQAALQLSQQFTEASQAEAAAIQEDMLGAVKDLAGGITGLIAGRRAQAAVECIFEVAQGAKQVAMALDPDDPRHVQHWLSAGQHFVAAADFGKVAGTGTSHHGGGGGSGSYGGGGGGGGSRDNRFQPQTLAPGAAGAGSRFGSPGTGVVIIRGTQEFENIVAHAVNSAVSRGVTVNATSSSRGAPVGH